MKIYMNQLLNILIIIREKERNYLKEKENGKKRKRKKIVILLLKEIDMISQLHTEHKLVMHNKFQMKLYRLHYQKIINI